MTDFISSRGDNPTIDPTADIRKPWVFYPAKTLARLSFSLFFHLTAEGTESIPRKRAFVILSKHQRWEDIPLLGLSSPRPLYYIAKYELFKHPMSGWLLKSLGGIPLDRASPLKSRKSLKSVIEFLKRDEGIVLFPEGTYFKDRMGPGHIGMVRLILSQTEVPFVPAGIKYSQKKGRILVRIRFGEPFYHDSYTPANEFLECMMQEIARLSGL